MKHGWLWCASLAGAVIGMLAGRAGRAATIAALRRDLATADRAARHDPLTGIPNRAGLLAGFTRRRPGLLVLLDLDGFKAVNDRHGHAVGDILLTRFARRLSEAASLRGGVAGRLGGDEFVVLLPASPQPGCVVADILAVVCRPVPLAGAALTVRASAGVCVVDGMSWSQALRLADIALYEAKTGRRALTGDGGVAVKGRRPLRR